MTEEERNRQDPEVANFCDHPELKRKFLGIEYAHRTPFEKMDLYLPEQDEGPYPVIIDVHGGGWFYGSRSSKRMDPVLQGLKRGYAVASVDYTLSKYEKFPLQILELKAAIRFLRQNAEKYGLDEKRMAMWGLSAGAHLSMLTAFTADTCYLEDKDLSDQSVSCSIQALVALYGPTDLTITEMCTQDSMETIFLGGIPREETEHSARANPCNYVSKYAPPCFLQYGDADELVILKHGEAIRDALQAVRQDKDYFEVIHGARHADTLFRTPENNRKIFEFLDAHMK